MTTPVDRDSLCDHLTVVLLEDNFKFTASAAAVKFVENFRLELMYISLIIDTRSSLTYLYGFKLLVLRHSS